MTGFTSTDDLINKISAQGKFFSTPFSKQMNPTAAAVANEWHTLFRGGGFPQADAIFDTGTNLLFNSLSDQTASAGNLYHGGDVGANGDDFKVLLSGYAVTAAATTVPCTIQLIDVLGWIRRTDPTQTTAQTVIWPYRANGETLTFSSSSGLLGTYTNDIQNLSKVRFTNSGGALPGGLAINTDYWTIRVGATSCRFATTRTNAIAGTAIAWADDGTGTNKIEVRLPRYSDGIGVQQMVFNPSTAAFGAATPVITTSYSYPEATAGRATPTTPSGPVGKTAATASHIIYTGAAAAGKFGPGLPLQATDAGTATIQSIRNSTSYGAGMYTTALYVPIAEIPLQVLGQATIIDWTQAVMPSFPRIYDGAALYWIIRSGVATPSNSNIDGRLNFGWG